MTTSSPPMTPPSLRRLPAENLAPGRHKHSQTAAISSRRGDERRGADNTALEGLPLHCVWPSCSWQPARRQSAQPRRAGHWCPSRLPTRPTTDRPKGGRRRARAYLRRNPTFPLDVEPWGGAPMCRTPPLRRVPRHHRGIRHTGSWPGGHGATEVPLRICASCAALLWQTAPRRAICGSDRPFSALRDHFVRDFQQPASECENKGC